jgi:protease-4
MNDSILSSSLRSFLKAFFSVIGIALGFLIVILLFAALLSSSNETELESDFSAEILPNAEGVRKSVSKDAPVILQVDLVGLIGVESLTSDKIHSLLIESREGSLKNNRVKGVLLRIQTPGGTVIDADGIYHALMRYKKQYKVPIYAYVDGMCASGGMYAAVAADKIYASSASLVGSIGVIIPPLFNVTQLIDKIGVQSVTLSAGKGKDELNPFRAWKPNEAVHMQKVIDYYYEQFVQLVVQQRPQLDKQKLIEEYGAKVFPAEQAKEFGFIDESDLSYNETLKRLLKEIGIEDEYYQVIRLKSSTWLSSLLNSQSSLFTGKVMHQLQLTPDLEPALMNQFLYLYAPNL